MLLKIVTHSIWDKTKKLFESASTGLGIGKLQLMNEFARNVDVASSNVKCRVSPR